MIPKGNNLTKVCYCIIKRRDRDYHFTWEKCGIAEDQKNFSRCDRWKKIWHRIPSPDCFAWSSDFVCKTLVCIKLFFAIAKHAVTLFFLICSYLIMCWLYFFGAFSVFIITMIFISILSLHVWTYTRWFNGQVIRVSKHADKWDILVAILGVQHFIEQYGQICYSQ